MGPKSILGERSVLNSGTGEAAPCGATVTAASAVVVTISASRITLLDLFTKDPVAGWVDKEPSRNEKERKVLFFFWGWGGGTYCILNARIASVLDF